MSERPPGAIPRRPRIRTILLLVNLAILALPLAGIGALRLYENELIRGTEAQLLLLGGVVRDLYRDALRPAFATGEPAPPGPLTPLQPVLDVGREPVRRPAEPALPPNVPADDTAVAAGARISAALAQSARSTLVGIRIVDRHGIVVATTRTELGQSLAHREEVRRALAGETVSLLRERRSDEAYPAFSSPARGQRYRVFVALPVVDRGEVVGAVVLSRTPLDIAKALYLQRRPLLVGAGVVLAVVLAVSLLTAFAISRPMQGLIAQAERVASDQSAAVEPMRRPGTHEVALLSRSLSSMAQTLTHRAEYIRTFAAHVSHEFKGSLTGIRGGVELLRDHADTMTAADRERFLRNIDETALRLERLVRRLLEQARAEVLQPEPGAAADVAAVAASVVHRFAEEGMSVSWEGDDAVGAARIGPDALGEVLANLLDNARQHGGPEVAARVGARRTVRDGRELVEVEVSDDGPGISPANRERVFTPFFTTARERGGSGLGLSIVRSVVEAHGGTVALDPAMGQGTRVVVRLPR